MPLRITEPFKLLDNVSLQANLASDPIDLRHLSGFSCIAAYANGSQVAKTFAAGTAQVTELTCVADAGERNQTTITTPAETSVQQVDVVTFATLAGTTAADYVVLSNVAGTKWAVWLDTTGTDVAPTGAAFLAVPEGNRIRVDISGETSAAEVAAAVVTAIGVVMTDVTITDNVDGSVDFEQDLWGVCAAAVPHNAGDTGAGSISVVTTAGADSELDSTHFTISSVNSVTKARKDFYVWFNVNGQGVDPEVANRTAVPVTVATGAEDSAVAAAIDAALAALVNDFSVSSVDNGVTVTSIRVGAVPAAAGVGTPVGLVIATPTPGVDSNLNNKYFTIASARDVAKYAVWFNVDSLGVAPVVAGHTLVPVAIAYGSQLNTDVAAAVAALSLEVEGSPVITLSATNEVVTFTNADEGPCTAANVVSTGFTANVTATGSSPIDVLTNRITISSHGLVTGARVVLTKGLVGGDAVPAGLVDGTAYFVIVVDANTIKLAATQAAAAAGTALDITDCGKGTNTLTPSILKGTIRMEASNSDFSNPNRQPTSPIWVPVYGASENIAGDDADKYVAWNISDVNYAFARFVFVADAAAGDGYLTVEVCAKDS